MFWGRIQANKLHCLVKKKKKKKRKKEEMLIMTILVKCSLTTYWICFPLAIHYKKHSLYYNVNVSHWQHLVESRTWSWFLVNVNKVKQFFSVLRQSVVNSEPYPKSFCCLHVLTVWSWCEPWTGVTFLHFCVTHHQTSHLPVTPAWYI